MNRAPLALLAAVIAGATFILATDAIARPLQLMAAAPQSGSSEAPPGSERSPDEVARKVTAALASAPGVPARDISVTTHAGTIILSGKVGSEAEAARATAAAEAVATGEGARVTSQLEVREPVVTAREQADADLVSAVQSALQADARTAELDVTVAAQPGQIITLHGLVPSRESRATAQRIAASVKGVSQVENRLVSSE